jgi:hypothetical protein
VKTPHLEAAIEVALEVHKRINCIQRLPRDRLHDRHQIPRAMLQLGNENVLRFDLPPGFGDVLLEPDHSHGFVGFIEEPATSQNHRILSSRRMIRYSLMKSP